MSELIMVYFLPIYAIIEVSRMIEMSNISLLWILIIGIIFSIGLGYLFGVIICKIFKLDERIRTSYYLLLSLPSIGTLPLVLGKSLCYPGGPLEGDKDCVNIQGFMLLNYFLFQIILNFLGFPILIRDANFTNVLEEKMGYLWHIILEKLNTKNFHVLYLFKKYMNGNDLIEKFEQFDKNYKLIFVKEKHILKISEGANISLLPKKNYRTEINPILKEQIMKNVQQLENSKSINSSKIGEDDTSEKSESINNERILEHSRSVANENTDHSKKNNVNKIIEGVPEKLDLDSPKLNRIHQAMSNINIHKFHERTQSHNELNQLINAQENHLQHYATDINIHAFYDPYVRIGKR
jgi:hypothetical protein